MDVLLLLMIVLAISSGQLIKLPLSPLNGPTALDIVTLVLCLFGLFKIKFKLSKPPLFIKASLFFSLIALFSLLLTPLKLQSMQYIISLSYNLRYMMYILLGWLIISKAFPFLKRNNQILIISGVCTAVAGLMQFLFIPDLRFLANTGWDPHFYRNVSTFLDPNFAGGFFALTFLLILFYLQIKSTPKIYYLYLVIVYLALLTTFSRSSFLLFVISLLIFAFLKKSIKIVLLTTVLAIVLLLSYKVNVQEVNRVTPLDRSQTASLRLTTWQQGFTIFSKNPLTGIGFNAYNVALKQYSLGDEQFLYGKGSTTNDSSLLYVLATTGVIGFIAYILFLLGLTRASNPTLLIPAIIGLLAHSLFVNSLFYPFILIWLILAATSNDK